MFICQFELQKFSAYDVDLFLFRVKLRYHDIINDISVF